MLAINGEIGEPNEKGWVMHSAGVSGLVRAGSTFERCA
jgi:hypothetical protein